MKQLKDRMSVRPEFAGAEALIMNAPQTVTAQRSMMFSSHLKQFVITNGCEFPAWFTGFEHKFGQHLLETLKLEEPIVIQNLIPKFYRDVHNNPKTLVVYTTLHSRQIGCFELTNYMCVTDKFGFDVNRTNVSQLAQGTIVDPGTQFMQAGTSDGELYGFGVNSNMVFMAIPEVTEDARVISTDLQKRMSFTRIKQVEIVLSENDIPLNLYGNPDLYQILPKLGQQVLPHCVMLGIRKIKGEDYLSDFTDNKLGSMNISTDELYEAPKNSTLIDVDILFGTEFKGMDRPIYSQLTDMYQQTIQQHIRLISTYLQLKNDGFVPDDHFNALVYRSMSMVALAQHFMRVNWPSREIAKYMNDVIVKCGRRVLNLVNKKPVVRFIHMTLYYRYTQMANLGTKITGRDGSKGVISQIRPPEEMPVDEFGNRADMISAPISVVSRCIGSPLYEQYFTRVANDVAKEALACQDSSTATQHILEFLNITEPRVAEIIAKQCQTEKGREEFLLDIEERGMHFCIPPYPEERLIDKARKLIAKYGDKKSKIKFVVYNTDGSKTVQVSDNRMLIGSKYVLVLNKIPSDQMSSISLGYVNQHGLAIRPPKQIKRRAMYGVTPIRFGEDEVSISGISIPPDALVRWLGSQFTSIKALLQMSDDLLTVKKPTAYKHLNMSTKEIVMSTNNLAVMTHMLTPIGLCITEDPEG